MELLKKSTGVFVVILIAIGIKFWNKSASYNDIKDQILTFCGGVSQCQVVLSKHFDICFDSSYDMDSKGHSSGLDQTAFVQCVNSHAGSELLTLNH